MKDMKWDDAIFKVMDEEKRPLHYTETAELIVERNYRTNVGATPAQTVNANITVDIKDNGENSIYAKVDRGEYILRKYLHDISYEIEPTPVTLESNEKSYTTIIQALGMFWNREQVLWKTSPDLFGVQQIGANPINLNEQIGIYLLHDGREVIYVGQAIGQTITQRLFQHTLDRFSGRWDRFSWFGFYSVDDSGKTMKFNETERTIKLTDIADTLEAVLVESLEPRQNRKKGNTFSGIEYIQYMDPELKRKQAFQLLDDLKRKI